MPSTPRFCNRRLQQKAQPEMRNPDCPHPLPDASSIPDGNTPLPGQFVWPPPVPFPDEHSEPVSRSWNCSGAGDHCRTGFQFSPASPVRAEEAAKAAQILRARTAFGGQIDAHSAIDAVHCDAFHAQLAAERPDVLFSCLSVARTIPSDTGGLDSITRTGVRIPSRRALCSSYPEFSRLVAIRTLSRNALISTS